MSTFSVSSQGQLRSRECQQVSDPLCNAPRTQQIYTVSVTQQRLLAAARIRLLKKKKKKKGFAPNEPSANDMDTWLALSLFRLNYKTVDI